MNLENSRNYYGSVLGGSQDLRTDACCTAEAPAPPVREALANVHDEVKARYYGCGLVVPQALEGAHVLDLGSGSGRDAYMLAQLVGADGSVTGVDATPEQLAVAERHRGWHAERFGYDNVRFVAGDIEQLGELGLPESRFDVIVSNCVINLVADKLAVLRAARALLKPGGELYFSDVYADRRVPEHLRDDPVLHGECLSGALYTGDFDVLAKRAGFADPRLVTSRPLAIGDAELTAKVEGIGFVSATYRLFAIDRLEPGSEDYGLSASYRGTLPDAESFALDAAHVFPAGQTVPVSGNTWLMLAESRLAPHFELHGDFARHRGAFDAPAPASAPEGRAAGASCC